MKSVFLYLLLFCVVQKPEFHGNLELKDSGNIPMELIKEKIIVPVEINGQTYRFLVDTGGIFEISEALQQEFDFKQLETTTIVGINRKEIEIETVRIPEIRLGNWSFKNRKAIVSDLHSKYPYRCFELDGMIGRDFFDKVLLHFDLATNTFRLTENAENLRLNKNNRTKLKLSRRGLPEIKLKINGQKEYIEFDSGSGDFYSPKTSDVEKKLNDTSTTDILTFRGQFSFGITMDNIAPTNRYMEKVQSFQMASTTFHNFYSQFSKVSAPRIGAAILKYGKVTLDYKNGWFYYEAYSEKIVPPFTTYGFDVAIEDGTYRVKYILENSVAHRLGLRPGHKIVMIDGVSTENISEDCEGYLHGYVFKNGRPIQVDYLDNQQLRKSIEVTYMEL